MNIAYNKHIERIESGELVLYDCNVDEICKHDTAISMHRSPSRIKKLCMLSKMK